MSRTHLKRSTEKTLGSTQVLAIVIERLIEYTSKGSKHGIHEIGVSEAS